VLDDCFEVKLPRVGTKKSAGDQSGKVRRSSACSFDPSSKFNNLVCKRFDVLPGFFCNVEPFELVDKVPNRRRVDLLFPLDDRNKDFRSCRIVAYLLLDFRPELKVKAGEDGLSRPL
jgi:hypothetical protein